MNNGTVIDGCTVCAQDLTFIQTQDRPDYEIGDQTLKVVDLFAGGGGLTLRCSSMGSCSGENERKAS
jgi:hypothetical protein